MGTNESYLAALREGLMAFIAAGGRVLFGADVGYLQDADTRPEFAAMQTPGMDISSILHSLTTEPASFLALPDAGVLRPGATADLTVLETTASHPVPWDLADIHAVIRGGISHYIA